MSEGDNEPIGSLLPPDINEILMQNEKLPPDLENDLCSVTTAEENDLQLLDAISISSSDTASTASTTRRSQIGSGSLTSQRRVPTFMLKTGLLKNVTNHVANMKDKLDVGQFSCVTIGNWLAIGTTKSLVLLFDFHQNFVECLGNVAQWQAYGAVSALSFNRSSDRILVGFAKGHIDMWDISKLSTSSSPSKAPSTDTPLSSKRCTLLRSMDDVHALNYAVLFLRFTDDPTLALCGDSGGSVFQMQFKRGISGRTCDFSCLSSGSRGEICCIEPLLLPRNSTEHPIAQHKLVAMASFTQLNIISLTPNSQVLFKQPLKGDPSVFPLLAWQFLPLETTSQKSTSWRVDPVLAFARDATLHLVRAQLAPTPPHSLQFHVIQTVRLDYSIINMKWLANFTLCLIDKLEILHVMDLPSEEELDRYDLARVKLSYNSSLFKSLATGGNVSPALAYAGERACQHSVVVYEGQLLILGQKFLHLYMLRDWQERLQRLSQQGYLEAAVRLCLEYHQGTAKTYPGLEMAAAQRREKVERRVAQLVQDCLQAACAAPPVLTHSPSLARGIVAEFSVSTGLLLALCRLCACIDNQEEVLRIIFDMLSSCTAEGTPRGAASLALFLDILSDFISGDFLASSSSSRSGDRSIHTVPQGIKHVPPNVMQALLQHLFQRGELDKWQRCITRVDLTCLDLDQVARLCWTNGLYDAIIHIYTTAMLDYYTPLKKMTQKLQQHQDNVGNPLSPEQYEKLGQRLLVFTQASLRGESFSAETISNDISASIQDTAYHHLITKNSENMMPYLLFDTNEFLNMITLVMEEPFFNMPVIPESPQSRKELLVERIISLVLVSPETSRRFSSHQIGRLCVFLARKIDHEADRYLLEMILRHLEMMFEHVCSVRCQENTTTTCDEMEGACRPVDVSRHSNQELQQALVDLLHFVLVHTQTHQLTHNGTASGRPRIDLDRLALLVTTAKLHQVKEYILQQEGDYGPVVQCYLDDPDREHQVFNFVSWAFENPDLREEQRHAIHESCTRELPRLLHVSPEKTVLLFVKTFRDPIPSLVRLLENTAVSNKSELVFQFLRAAYRFSRDNEWSEESTLSVENSLNDSFLAEKFIQITCRHAPNEVLPFLKNHRVYNVERALQIVRESNLQREMGFLLERSNRIEDAARVYLQMYNNAWRRLEERVKRLSQPPLLLQDSDESGFAPETMESELEEVESNCHNYMRLCLQHATDWPPQRQQSIWYPLLDTILEAQRTHLDHILVTVTKRLFRILLSSMSHHLGLTTILAKILKDPAYAGERFINLQSLIMDMLETFHYESTLLQTCQRLGRHDLTQYYAHFLRQAQHGFAPRRHRCYACRKPYRTGVELPQQNKEMIQQSAPSTSAREEENIGTSMILFRCGHGFHAACLHKMRSYVFDYSIAHDFIGGDGDTGKVWLCPVCQESSHRSEHSRTFTSLTKMSIMRREEEDTTEGVAMKFGREEELQEEAEDLETALRQHEATHLSKGLNPVTLFLRASHSLEMRPSTLAAKPRTKTMSSLARYNRFVEEANTPNKIAVLCELAAMVSKETPSQSSPSRSASSSRPASSASRGVTPTESARSRFHTLMKSSRKLNLVPERPY